MNRLSDVPESDDKPLELDGATASPVTDERASAESDAALSPGDASACASDDDERLVPRATDQPVRDVDAIERQKQLVALPSVPIKRRGSIEKRVAALFHNVTDRAERSDRRHARVSAYALQMANHVVRQWARDRCHEKAASLAYQTVLSVVPLLALTLAVLRGVGHIDGESSFVEFLAREFIPVSSDLIAKQLTSWSDNVNLQSLGLVGLGASVAVAFVMVNSLEKIINHIWRAERRRALSQKFVTFYATATIGPFLLGTSLYQASQFGWTEGFAGLVTSIFTSFMALFMANYFLPALQVRVVPALLGALVSTVLFEIARYAFRVYVTEFAFASFSGVYGTLSLAPIWLLWIYYSWLVFLLGVEVAHVAQNLHLLRRSDRRRPMSLENEILHRVNGVTAARVMMAISAAYLGGDKVMPRRAIEDIFDLSDDVLTRIARRLQSRDLIIEVEGEPSGFVPARPPAEITLAEVMGAFRSSDIDTTGARTNTPLDQLLLDIERDTRERTETVTFDALVRGPADTLG